MTSHSAWTATVWGKGKSALLASAARKKGEGDEECMICRSDLPASVSLKPCNHIVCFSCVEAMRAKNIFRADKGVKCPFCRGFIDQYELMDSMETLTEIHELLDEANRAAAIACNARLRAAGGVAVTSGSGSRVVASGSGGAGGANGFSAGPLPDKAPWRCRACKNENYWFREECNMCQQPNPRPKAALAPGKDFMKAGGAAVVAACKEKGSNEVNKALADAGCSFQGGKRVGGSDASVQQAFKGKLGDRLVKIAQVLSDPAALREVALDYTGNFVVQNVVLALGEVRRVMAGGPGAAPSPSPTLAAFKAANRGLDPLGAMLQAALPHYFELATCPATYMLQKMADAATPSELLDLAAACVPNAVTLILDSKSVFVMLNILRFLGDKCPPGGDARERAADVADAVCAAVLTAGGGPTDQESVSRSCHSGSAHPLSRICHLGLSAKAMAEAIAVGLPRHNALQLASAVAADAAILANNKGGILALLPLVTVRAADGAGADALLRDVVCIVVMKLQGNLAGYCLSSDSRGAELVLSCVQRLAEEQEAEWIDVIAQELVGKGDVMLAAPDAMEVLLSTLSCGVLAHGLVTAHLSQLGELVGDAVHALSDEVERRLAARGPAPARKYHSPSMVKPNMQLLLEGGHQPLLPPPPPPPESARGVPPRPTSRPTAAAAAAVPMPRPAHTSSAPSFAPPPFAPAPFAPPPFAPPPAAAVELNTQFDMSYLLGGGSGAAPAAAAPSHQPPPTNHRSLAVPQAAPGSYGAVDPAAAAWAAEQAGRQAGQALLNMVSRPAQAAPQPVPQQQQQAGPPPPSYPPPGYAPAPQATPPPPAPPATYYANTTSRAGSGSAPVAYPTPYGAPPAATSNGSYNGGNSAANGNGGGYSALQQTSTTGPSYGAPPGYVPAAAPAAAPAGRSGGYMPPSMAARSAAAAAAPAQQQYGAVPPVPQRPQAAQQAQQEWAQAQQQQQQQQQQYAQPPQYQQQQQQQQQPPPSQQQQQYAQQHYQQQQQQPPPQYQQPQQPPPQYQQAPPPQQYQQPPQQNPAVPRVALPVYPPQPVAAGGLPMRPPVRAAPAAAGGGGPPPGLRPAEVVPPVAIMSDWVCETCTYSHSGGEAGFLVCAMCEAKR